MPKNWETAKAPRLTRARGALDETSAVARGRSSEGEKESTREDSRAIRQRSRVRRLEFCRGAYRPATGDFERRRNGSPRKPPLAGALLVFECQQVARRRDTGRAGVSHDEDDAPPSSLPPRAPSRKRLCHPRSSEPPQSARPPSSRSALAPRVPVPPSLAPPWRATTAATPRRRRSRRATRRTSKTWARLAVRPFANASPFPPDAIARESR